MEVLRGNAVDQRILEAAGIKQAGHLLIAIPEAFEAGAIFEHARALNPDIRVIARAHSDAEVQHLERLGVPDVVMGEREIASRMLVLSLADRASN
jgi:CPA2 family monovalent cation:H+ antiporter-2